jgi:hypothetical protein
MSTNGIPLRRHEALGVAQIRGRSDVLTPRHRNASMTVMFLTAQGGEVRISVSIQIGGRNANGAVARIAAQT